MSTSLHPRQALFQGASALPLISACEHFAGSAKLIGKAFTLQQEMDGAFDVTLDCEDGAPAGAERQHAEMLAELLRTRPEMPGAVGVRLHDPQSPHWQMELEILLKGAGERISYLTVPKAKSAAAVRSVLQAAGEASRRHGLSTVIPLHVLIETPSALKEVGEIAAIPEVRVLDFGLLDFIAEHGGAISSAAMKSPGQFSHRLVVRAKTEIAAAALGCGKIPSHNITLQLREPEQVFADARRAREEFGFLRMWSIHPAQIRPILEAMSPSFAEVAEAEAILLKGWASAWAPISHENQLHDRASYRYFWQLLERARLAQNPISAAAESAFFPAPPSAA